MMIRTFGYFRLMTQVIFLSIIVLFHSTVVLADNASEIKESIKEIKKLFSRVNKEIEHGNYRSLFIYVEFPSNEHFVQKMRTDEFELSPDRTLVYYRGGYIAKIQRQTTDGDIEVDEEYYFRENGSLFFYFNTHDELTGPQKEVPVEYEKRYYIDSKGRLIRFAELAYEIKKGREKGLIYTKNEDSLGVEATDELDITNVKQYQFYKDIKSHMGE